MTSITRATSLRRASGAAPVCGSIDRYTLPLRFAKDGQLDADALRAFGDDDVAFLGVAEARSKPALAGSQLGSPSSRSGALALELRFGRGTWRALLADFCHAPLAELAGVKLLLALLTPVRAGIMWRVCLELADRAGS